MPLIRNAKVQENVANPYENAKSVCMYICLLVCLDSLGPRELEVTMTNSIAHSVDTIHSQPV